MIIHVYTTCRNEKYMMPFWLRHYSTFADRLFVLDDCSEDGTREIVQAHSHATLLPYGFDDGLHEDHINQAYMAAYKEHSRGVADWVICCDVDELLYRPNMREALFQAFRNRVDAIPADGYIMVADQPPEGEGQLYDYLTQGIPSPPYSKTLIFNPAMDVSFGEGRHTTNLPEGCIVKDIDMLLLHYCWLSRDYIRQRIERNFNRMLWKDPQARRKEMMYRIGRAMVAYDQSLVTRLSVI